MAGEVAQFCVRKLFAGVCSLSFMALGYTVNEKWRLVRLSKTALFADIEKWIENINV